MPDTDTPETEFDVVVVGGGSGGYACALRAAGLGLSVALVERDKVGGTCLHRGCIPTKALLQAAEVADRTRESETFGVRATLEGIDPAGLASYRDRVVDKLYRGLEGLVDSRGITVLRGTGRLVSPVAVDVEGRTVVARRGLVLATGSRPRSVPGIEPDGVRVLTSDHALTLDRVPRSAVVLGGGVIGTEFASAWRSFGVEVTIVEAASHLLPTEQVSSSKALERAFRRRKIAQKLRSTVTEVKATEEGVEVTLGSGATLEAEVLLVAVGREPATDGLDLAAAGLDTDRGFVPVDEHCRTKVDGIFAVGDVRPGLQLAHVGFAEGIMVAELVAGLDPEPVDHVGVPRVTYSDPQVASVGLTAAQAAERGLETVEVSYDLAGNGRTQILAGSGSVTLVAEPDGRRVLGMHLVGPNVGELIAEGQLITNLGLPAAQVARLVHPHPTVAEAVGEAHLALVGKPLHAHG
ncbi:dihydrolipoyl dehydrogenase [Pseudonocardia lutea]|uniref:Dihydrolipoyl dehydrogenase n=1 Tax=Pseudonocardia lutea TaxID=2172015 RepID=A0ABW1IAS1_9PSEU